MSFSLSLTIKKILSDIFDIKNEKIDASRLEGTIPIETLPPAALERVVIVKDDAARFALTKEKAQNGDTVKVNDTKKMYFVNDDTKLNVEDGYEEYVTGGAASAAIADKAKLALDSEKLGGLTLENIRNEVKTYPANLQDQSIKNRHLAPDLKITADNIADNTITKNQLSLRAGDLDAYTKRESNEAIERAVNALKGATPQVLDTLQKIAAALNNDPNFATTITNALNSKANKNKTYTKDEVYNKNEIDQSCRKIGSHTANGFFDWNDLTEPTTYEIINAQNSSDYNAPPEFEPGKDILLNGFLIVHCLEENSNDENNIVQIYYSYAKNNLWTRMRKKGIWNTWMPTITPDTIGYCVENKVNKTGDTMTGNLTANIIAARNGFEGNLRGTADMAIKIKGNKLVFENGTELWIE